MTITADGGGNTKIAFDANDSVTLVGISDPHSLHASDFLLVAPDQASAVADKNGGANGDGYARQAMLLAQSIAGSFATPANEGGNMVANTEAQNPLLAAPHNQG